MFYLNTRECPIDTYALTTDTGSPLSANAQKTFQFDSDKKVVTILNNINKDLKTKLKLTATTIGGVSASQEI